MERLVQRFNEDNEVYRKYFEAVIKIQKMARLMLFKNPEQKSNCKLIAKRLRYYSIKKAKKQIMLNLQKYQDFLMKTYSGVYCGLCNFDNHKFINIRKNRITYSYGFCREYVENSLPTMLLFHSDIIKLSNLALRFIT